MSYRVRLPMQESEGRFQVDGEADLLTSYPLRVATYERYRQQGILHGVLGYGSNIQD